MKKLYPLRFNTIFKEKIWGGNKIRTVLGKDFSPLPNCGETWEISGVEGNISVVKEGLLAGESLPQLIETYQGQLLGEKVYERFGNNFPLLIKFIDANDDLSIQVHPNDALAAQRHASFGKTEMWYILQADPGARLNTGFNKPMDEKTYLHHLHNKTLEKILNFEDVKSGDVFFLPAGRVHYIGKGICLAEIQQTSDITYRIYDFDRKDDKGNPRELHTDLALEAIDYTYYGQYKTEYIENNNQPTSLVSCQYFSTNLLTFDKPTTLDYNHLDSFIIYIILEGGAELTIDGDTMSCAPWDCVLVPAALKKININPTGKCRMLEVFIP